MALQNQPGLYQGQAPLNPLPYVNIALQQRARRQAREDAIDKYYRELPNTINDKGIRDAEIPLINEYRNKIFEYGLKNKEALKKGDGAAQFNLEKLIREAQGVAQESKNRAATSLKIAQLRGNPKYDYIFRNPKIMEQIEAHDKGIAEQGSEAINFNQLTLPPPPFDVNKYRSGIKVKPNPTNPTYQDIPGDDFSKLEITGKKFSPEDLNSIHLYAQSVLENDPSFEEEIKNKVKNNPETAAKLSSIFQEQYGHPINNDADLAAAYTLSLEDLTPTQKRVPKTKELIDYKNEQGFKYFKNKQKILQADRKELLGMRLAAQDANDEVDDLWYDRYLNQVSDESKRPENRQEYKLASGEKINGYKVQLDPVLSKAVGIDAKNPGQLLVTDNGDYILGFYDTDENFNPIRKDGKYVIDPSRRTTITKDALKLALGGKTGVKQLNKEMNKPSKPIKVTAKKGELDDL